MSNNIFMIGFIIGFILVIIPEPATSAIGLLIMSGCALSMGWLE